MSEDSQRCVGPCVQSGELGCDFEVVDGNIAVSRVDRYVMLRQQENIVLVPLASVDMLCEVAKQAKGDG